MLGFFLGGLLGAFVIFFLGTKEGKKAGKLLERKGRDVLDDLEEKLVDIEKKSKEVVEAIAENKEDISENVTEKLDSALAHIEEIQERGRETTAGLRKKLFKNLPKKS
jgi:gas vesicle protein